MAATLRGTTGDVKDNITSNKDLEELCRHINNRNRVRHPCGSLHGALGNGIPLLTEAFVKSVHFTFICSTLESFLNTNVLRVVVKVSSYFTCTEHFFYFRFLDLDIDFCSRILV